MASTLPRVTVFYEDTPQPQQEAYERAYPTGIGRTLQSALHEMGLSEVGLARLTDEGNGLSSDVLEATDVLVWWTHKAADRVLPATTAMVHERVLGGMGLIVLHSSFTSDVFQRLMGTIPTIHYRNVGERERLWVVDRMHPIAQGIERFIELDGEEMYGEEFDVPTPDELVFISWFEGGEVFRSGCCWRRGRGKIFFFRPGHETAPTYHHSAVKRVLYNACCWAAPTEPVQPARANVRVLPPEAGPLSAFRASITPS
jgi:trehalose utilization protein